jgi:hypothetical protein
MIVTTDHMFWMLAACTYRCAARAASGLEPASMEQSSRSSGGGGYPLVRGELLFQVTSDGLLLLPSEGNDTLVHTCLIQGLACGSHDDDESLCQSGL